MSIKSILTSAPVRNVARIAVGLLFIFSGFVKSVDPTGSSIKFGEYFLALHLNFLEPASMFFAIVMCALEFWVGIALLFNIRTLINTWAAVVLMAVFTPLTFYLAVTDAVADCGCFGDFVKLSNWGTFYKNVVIDIFIFLLWYNRNNYRSVLSVKNDYIALLVIMGGCLGFNIYNIMHSPVIDFRPFKVGTDIRAGMIMPPGKEPDKFAYDYTLTNIKTKAVKIVNSDEYLKQKIWEDTTWQITKTGEPYLIKAGYKPPIHDLRIENAEPIEISGVETGKDLLDSALNAPYCMWMLSYDLNKMSEKGLKKAIPTANVFRQKKIAFFCMTSSGSDDIKAFRAKYNPSFFMYNTDQTTIKTIERANPSFVLLRKGVVVAKWHYNDLPDWAELEKLMK